MIINNQSPLLISFYKDCLVNDTKALRQTQEQIACFASIANKYIHEKKLHDLILENIELLKDHKALLIKDIKHDREKLGYQESGDSIRFRME